MPERERSKLHRLVRGLFLPGWLLYDKDSIVMWPFKKREPVKKWDSFRRLDYCNDCTALEDDHLSLSVCH